MVLICGENSNLLQFFHSLVVNLPFDPLKNVKWLRLRTHFSVMIMIIRISDTWLRAPQYWRSPIEMRSLKPDSNVIKTSFQIRPFFALILYNRLFSPSALMQSTGGKSIYHIIRKGFRRKTTNNKINWNSLNRDFCQGFWLN